MTKHLGGELHPESKPVLSDLKETVLCQGGGSHTQMASAAIIDKQSL